MLKSSSVQWQYLLLLKDVEGDFCSFQATMSSFYMKPYFVLFFVICVEFKLILHPLLTFLFITLM